MVRAGMFGFDLPPNFRRLRLEYNKARQTWMVWIHANKDHSLGTFLELHKDGKLYRVQWHEDGSETMFPYTGGAI